MRSAQLFAINSFIRNKRTASPNQNKIIVIHRDKQWWVNFSDPWRTITFEKSPRVGLPTIIYFDQILIRSSVKMFIKPY